jgi:putative transposase
MSLPRRIVPGRVYMVTRRCTQRQFLLRPDTETTNAFLYCLGLAVQRTGMQVIGFIAQANHHHTIVVDVHGRMPEFLEGFHKLLAKHQNALRGRWENFWASEATSVVELLEPDDVLAKLTYALCNPVKDHLVERADQWPGASSLHANLGSRTLNARRPTRFFRKDGDLPEVVTVQCVRPSGFGQLSHDQWHALLGERIAAVERAAAAERQSNGRRVMGRRQVLRQRPTDRPASHEPRRQPSPRLASLNKWARIEAIQRSKAFLAAYRVARNLWRAGLAAIFPPGTYWLRLHGGVVVDPSTG